MAIFLTVLLIIAIVIGLFVLLRNQHGQSRARMAARSKTTRKPGTGSLPSLRENNFFWGAELGLPGCAESYKLLGRQFSFEKAPEFPLTGCSRDVCTCQFKGLRDRRMRGRRAESDRRSEVRFDKFHPDRRSQRSRRRGDLWANRSL